MKIGDRVKVSYMGTIADIDGVEPMWGVMPDGNKRMVNWVHSDDLELAPDPLPEAQGSIIEWGSLTLVKIGFRWVNILRHRESWTTDHIEDSGKLWKILREGTAK